MLVLAGSLSVVGYISLFHPRNDNDAELQEITRTIRELNALDEAEVQAELDNLNTEIINTTLKDSDAASEMEIVDFYHTLIVTIYNSENLFEREVSIRVGNETKADFLLNDFRIIPRPISLNQLASELSGENTLYISGIITNVLLQNIAVSEELSIPLSCRRQIGIFYNDTTSRASVVGGTDYIEFMPGNLLDENRQSIVSEGELVRIFQDSGGFTIQIYNPELDTIRLSQNPRLLELANHCVSLFVDDENPENRLPKLK